MLEKLPTTYLKIRYQQRNMLNEEKRKVKMKTLRTEQEIYITINHSSY